MKNILDERFIRIKDIAENFDQGPSGIPGAETNDDLSDFALRSRLLTSDGHRAQPPQRVQLPRTGPKLFS